MTSRTSDATDAVVPEIIDLLVDLDGPPRFVVPARLPLETRLPAILPPAQPPPTLSDSSPPPMVALPAPLPAPIPFIIL